MRLTIPIAAMLALILGVPRPGSRAADEPKPVARPKTIKVAAVQCFSDLGAVEANCRKLSALVEEAADREAPRRRTGQD